MTRVFPRPHVPKTGAVLMTANESDESTRLLEGAYVIKTVEDNIEYYRDFAEVYDKDFAEQMGYCYPVALAEVFMQFCTDSDNPVADIGCGTGLVANSINALSPNQIESRLLKTDQFNTEPAEHNSTEQPSIEIDGIDISTEMLNAARDKNLYRALYQADLTRSLNHLPSDYGAIISAGTFTFGHLGPDILPQLLLLGRAQTLYCIGVNSAHFAEQGFLKVLNSMVDKKQITQPQTVIKKIYDLPVSSESGHTDDTATILVYRQLMS